MGRRTIERIAADDRFLASEIADLLADVPSGVTVCPVHGAECPVWSEK